MSIVAHEFKDAVVRLTVVYMAVLALVCVVFSVALYGFASHEIDNGLRRQAVGFRGAFGRPMIDEQATEDFRQKQSEIAHNNLRTKLLITNIVVISLGSGFSYWFAKKTLEPLEENVKNQERFTADASHELRTPLAVMKSEIEVNLRDKNLTLEEAKDVLSSNLEEVEQLNTMVNQLLHLARAGELGEKNPIEPKALLKSIVADFNVQKLGKAVHVNDKTPSTRVLVHDSVIEHIARILIDNALKYGSDKVSVKIIARIEKRHLVVEVSDNGPGIPTAEQGKIFERFYRSDMSRTKQGSEGGGHGLGLSIARQLASKADGTLTLTSIVGRGSTFTLRMPCDTIES